MHKQQRLLSGRVDVHIVCGPTEAHGPARVSACELHLLWRSVFSSANSRISIWTSFSLENHPDPDCLAVQRATFCSYAVGSNGRWPTGAGRADVGEEAEVEVDEGGPVRATSGRGIKYHVTANRIGRRENLTDHQRVMGERREGGRRTKCVSSRR